jgi:hypothetical protein
MESEQVTGIRRFSRLFTQRIAALDEHFLGRDRSLGASRLLFRPMSALVAGLRIPSCSGSGPVLLTG